jgi:hypothetical protein
MEDSIPERRKRGRSYSSGCYRGSYPFLEDKTSPDLVFIGAANASFSPLSRNVNLKPMIGTHSPPVIMTAHGCLLIPAAFFAWWYWTKHTTRRVVRGVLTFARGRAPTSVDQTALGMSEDSVFSNPTASSPSTAATEECPDPFFGLHEHSTSDSSTTFRFIRWLKGTKSSRLRYKARAKTRNLHSAPNPSVDTVDRPRNQNTLQADSAVSGDATTYENIMAVELCSLEDSGTPHLQSKGSEKRVNITIEIETGVETL